VQHLGFAPPALSIPPCGVPLRAPQHPGRLLARYCLQPLALSQSQAARLLGMSRRRLHELVHGQRTMTPDTAIRCARQFGIDVGFLLTSQAAWDSFHAWKRVQAEHRCLCNCH
jgi:addiction module HigA family antidote